MAATASSHDAALEEELPCRHHPSRGVDAECAVQSTIAPVEREELGVRHGSSDHLHLVVGSGPTEELDAVLELIAPEERQRFVGLEGFTGSESPQVRRDVGALFGSVRPVLDAHLLVEEPVRPASNIAGSEHARHDRTRHIERVEVGVTDDPVAQAQPTSFEPVRVRRDADTDDDRVGGNDLTTHEADAVGRQSLDEDTTADLDTVRTVQLGDRLAHLGAKATDQWGRRTFEHHHVVAEGLGSGRRFEPDEAGADHDDAAPPADDLAAQPDCIVERAEFVDVVEGVLVGESSRVGAGGDHQPIEAQDGTVREGEFALLHVECGRRGAEAPLDVEIVEDVRLAEVDPIWLPFAGQQLLRQRRAVVGPMHLVADDHDRGGHIMLAECFGGAKARQ